MSFVQADDVMVMTEKMIIAALEKTVPYLKIPSQPFPWISYKEAMSKVSDYIPSGIMVDL